jgi:uncharacterized protein (DUF1499 family)
MALSHEAEAVFPQPRDRVYEAVVQAIEGLPKMKVKEGDPVRGHLDVSKTVSWKSWGEKITVDLSEPNPGQTRVKLRSAVRAQLVDWGVNRQNVEAIVEATTQRLGAPGGAVAPPEG